MPFYYLLLICISPIISLSVYKDIFTDDELLTDVWKMDLVNETVYEVHGRLVRRNHGDLHYHDLCPSKKLSCKTYDAKEKGIDVILQHNLMEYGLFEKDPIGFAKHFDEYVQRLAWRIKRPDSKRCSSSSLTDKGIVEANILNRNINNLKAYILGRFDKFKFYASRNTAYYKGMILPAEFRSVDGQLTPIVFFIKHGLEEVKVL